MEIERDRDVAGRPKNARPRDMLGRPLPRGAVNQLPEEPDPASDEEALTRGIAMFNQGRFYEAHEMWEFGWHPAPEPERDFWQGIIQVAVGFCHFQRGNMHGAITLMERGARRLGHYGKRHNGLAVADIAAAATAAVQEIKKNGTEASPVPPSIERFS